MRESYFEEVFREKDLKDLKFPAEFEDCEFLGCTLENMDLGRSRFEECVFKDCQLKMCNLPDTSFQNVTFDESKLVGMLFEHCSAMLLSMTFTNCQLSLPSFRGLDLKESSFKDSKLEEADFTGADLSAVVFDSCRLDRSIFERSNLEGTDFRTAEGFSLDPERNQMKGAKFTTRGLSGLLEKHGLDIEH